jgi:hypothetical protein
MKLSLPTDSNVRKTYPLFSGLFGYFGAALAGVAHHSWRSNKKHNAGQPLHWSIDKSNDHADCIARHLLDLGDMLAAYDREWSNKLFTREPTPPAILAEADALAWRALALSQTLRMRFTDVPLPFNARRNTPEVIEDYQDVREAQVLLKAGPSPGCTICEQQHCICEQQLG